MARSYLSAVASGAVGNVSWYDFREDGEDPLYNEHHFGVVRRNLQPKAAYLALATVCRTIADKPLRGVPAGEEIADDLFAYRFGTDAEETAVAWTARTPRISGRRWM